MEQDEVFNQIDVIFDEIFEQFENQISTQVFSPIMDYLRNFYNYPIDNLNSQIFLKVEESLINYETR